LFVHEISIGAGWGRVRGRVDSSRKWHRVPC
jgi:hypothetical protein